MSVVGGELWHCGETPCVSTCPARGSRQLCTLWICSQRRRQ